MEILQNCVDCPNCNQEIEVQVAAFADNEHFVCPKCKEEINIASQEI